MFGKKKQAPQPDHSGSRKGSALMNQMGFGGMDGMEDDDEDLEAELAALTGGEVKKPVAKKKAPLDMSVIDRMAAESMRDIGSDEELSDTDDPDLLAELEDLTTDSPSPPESLPSPEKQPKTSSNQSSLLQERLSMYQQASANAKAAGDASKQRRLDRGIKTLSDLCKRSQSGRPVPEDEIPPPVALGSTSKQSSPQHTVSPTQPTQPAVQQPSQPTLPSRPAPGPPPVQTRPAPPAPVVQHTAPPAPVTTAPSGDQDSEVVKTLHLRRDQYRNAALTAKKNNDLTTAARYVKTCRQFDGVIKAAEEGKTIDLSQMPPPPPEFGGPPAKESTQAPSLPKAERAAQQAAPPPEEEDAPPAPTQEEARELFKAPPPPSSTMDALQQRLQKYQTAEQEAKAAGEGSKARRMGRITKQYQDAIRAVKAGRQVDFSELPTPPGFAPIPVGNTGPPAPKPAAQSPPQAPVKPQGGPSPQRAPAPAQRQTPPQHPQINKAAASRTSISSRAEQQERFLQDRYEEFKQAALKAKRNNEMELAKNYVRCMQGMKPMLQAAAAGLPVDLAQVPPSPIADIDDDDKFVVVSAEDCQLTGDRDEVFETLKQDLIRQIRTCATNTQHFTKLGDVPSAAKFQKLEQNSRKDLEALKNANLHGDPIPKFHYETRSFSIVKCNTDLGDNDLEIGIVRAIQLPLPSGHSEKDLDTYVKFEFPYPNDEPQSEHTETLKGTIDPEYQENFKVKIDRKSRSFHRVVERKAIKIEVFYKRGFFKGDKALGSVNVKLLPLDQHSTVHDSYDLMDGRKTVGGKLEVKIRIRDPFKHKEVETVKEKWLVIDQFLRTLKSGAAKGSGNPPLQRQKSVGGTACMEVLRFERQQLDKQISYLKDSLSVTQTQTLKHKSALLGEKIDLQQKQLREGGVEAWKAYVEAVREELPSFEAEARQLTKVGDMQKAQMLLTKKKLAEKELAAIKAKIPDA